MPLFDITINILVLFAIMCLSALVGFAWRSKQIRKKERRINELEREMVEVHAEILNVQKEYCELESRAKSMSIPVIPISQATKDAR